MIIESAISGQQRFLSIRSFFGLLLFLTAVFHDFTECHGRRTPSPSPSPPLPPQFIRKGLRLVRASQVSTNTTSRRAKSSNVGMIGRLEVKIAKNRMLLGYPDNGGWAPLCDDGSFDMWRAQEFCDVLGFKYGMKYNGSLTSYGADDANRPRPLGQLICFDQPWHRRPANWFGWIDFPSRLSKFCYLYWSDCPSGQLVALQCSDSPLSPPLPPRPPTPPEPDYSLGSAIRHLYLESNLEAVSYFGVPKRVELLVNSSPDGHSGEPVWAPLCASPAQLAVLKQEPRTSFGDDPDIMANISCYQSDVFTQGWFISLSGYALTPARIPSEPVSNNSSSNDSGGYGYGVRAFDPSSYTHWVTVVDAIQKDRFALQDMKLNVSTTPCESGYLFTVSCNLIVP